jgi:hypothetical protein
MEWFADTTNGIGEMFARVFRAKRRALHRRHVRERGPA